MKIKATGELKLNDSPACDQLQAGSFPQKQVGGRGERLANDDNFILGKKYPNNFNVLQCYSPLLDASKFIQNSFCTAH